MNFIANTHFDIIYEMFNSNDSTDENWLHYINVSKKDAKSCKNDFEYRKKFGKSLLPDYMFEHTYERMFGLISKNLNLEIKGI